MLMYFKPLLLILFALSFVPYLATHVSDIHDSRVEFVLHAMPTETSKVCVASAPNVVFEQQFIQCPDPEMSLQLDLMQCFRQVTNKIRQGEVALCVRCALQPRQREGFDTSEYSAAHFLFLTSNELRDKEVLADLRDKSAWSLGDNHITVYEVSGSGFFCLPKPGLLIFTNNQSLMHTILSRLNAWWLKPVALPANLLEWKYVNQQAPYWGLEHFSFPDQCASESEAERKLLKGLSVGTVFDYMDKNYDLHLTYVASNLDECSSKLKDVSEFDPRTGQHMSMKYLDKNAMRISVSNSRGSDGWVSSILENFSLRPTWGR